MDAVSFVDEGYNVFREDDLAVSDDNVDEGDAGVKLADSSLL